MNTQTQMLLATAVLAILHIMPYFLAYLKYWGISGIVGNRENLPALPAWAERARSAHQNMNENFSHFAVLVLIANYLGIATDLTAMGAMLFFWARLIYLAVFILGIPWVRTIVFMAGLVGEFLIVAEILK